jgi:hypothetical protein
VYNIADPYGASFYGLVTLIFHVKTPNHDFKDKNSAKTGDNSCVNTVSSCK